MPGAPMVGWEGRDERNPMASLDPLQVGARLDEHHLPETNGRMAVCRRCGARTDGPSGHRHIPGEGQLVRSDKWLDAEAHLSRINDERLRRSAL